MNKKIILITITIFLLLAGCGKSIPTNTTKQDAKSQGTAITPSVSNTDNNKDYLVLEAYKSVLENKVNFFSADNNKNVYLNDFLANEELYGTALKITHFTMLDMDGDKIPEVVLELSVGNNNPMCFEVLHYMNNAVYGYNIVYRGLEELKTDGTFIYSNGASDNGCGKLRFEANTFKTDTLGYSKSSEENNKLTIAYFINNKPVSEELFNTFMKEQQGKKGVIWYEFSQKNIKNELSANP